MDHELYEQASHPIVRNLTGTVLLGRLTEAARAQALEALSAALARPEALELADALAAPLAEAREAAAEPEAAVAAARKALEKEKSSIHARLAAWHKSRIGAAADDTQPPAQDTAAVQELQAAVTAAEKAAAPLTARVRYHENQIADLRACPPADAATLAVLAAVLEGGHRDDAQ